MLIIQDVDLTPDTQALKFILSAKLILIEKRPSSTAESAAEDSFAKGIFQISGVESVFYMDKFVTIEKNKDVSWGQIQKPFINFLKSFDKNLIPAEKEITVDANSDALLKQINQILDQRVRPALAGDGGGLEVLGIEGFTVRIRYQGACGSCPSSISGTLSAIEGLLKRDVDPAIEVVPG